MFFLSCSFFRSSSVPFSRVPRTGKGNIRRVGLLAGFGHHCCFSCPEGLAGVSPPLFSSNPLVAPTPFPALDGRTHRTSAQARSGGNVETPRMAGAASAGHRRRPASSSMSECRRGSPPALLRCPLTLAVIAVVLLFCGYQPASGGFGLGRGVVGLGI